MQASVLSGVEGYMLQLLYNLLSLCLATEQKHQPFSRYFCHCR